MWLGNKSEYNSDSFRRIKPEKRHPVKIQKVIILSQTVSQLVRERENNKNRFHIFVEQASTRRGYLARLLQINTISAAFVHGKTKDIFMIPVFFLQKGGMSTDNWTTKFIRPRLLTGPTRC